MSTEPKQAPEAQQETQRVEGPFILNECRDAGHQAPDDQAGSQPDARAQSVQREIAGHLQDHVAEEKDAGPEAEYRGAESQCMVHLQTGEAEIDAVQVVEKHHQEQQRYQVQIDFPDGCCLLLRR